MKPAIASLAASGSKLVSVNKVYQIDVDSRRVSFRVDACFPVCEGVLTLHTRVVVFVAAVGWSRDEDNTQCEGVSIIDEVEALLFSPLGFDLSLGRVQPSIAATPHALRGSFHQEHECDQIIVLNTAALVQLGVAEDHYVSVSPVNTSLDELSTRLCRVRVDNNNIIPSNSQHHVALLSPFTIFNLKLVESSSIRIQRVGPEFTHASIPRASHVTVARIAGPLTTNMKYLDLCLDALKNWVLGASMRLVAVGDVIGVLVDGEKLLSKCETMSQRRIFMYTCQQN
ncbi:hypothetical protein BC830DRAFT_285796 [Chytriomyces sp. MP71]|nr:hypothetical protein BC830DRAFT_285796 [Chytriomyces sp. MP71]